ncbi:PQQ-binding-like beta-propeller repeat protein [Actinoplanes sp. NPDC051861]|uniref:outer membrane protein assembly factor BamB family protein n=1 Tax=Actinoplanes sp. NPDC051861 TaxID=3155170 RepID=UPI0034268867
MSKLRRILSVGAAVLALAGCSQRADRPPVEQAGDRVTGLTPVGSPITLFGPTADKLVSTSAVAGGRIFTASGAWYEPFKMIAVDATTGATAWDMGPVSTFDVNVGPMVFHGALLVGLRSRIEVRDPATGDLRWALPTTGHNAVVSDSVVADVVDGGVTEGYDLATGRKLWTVPPPGGDRPVKQTGMRTGDEYSPEPGARREIRISDGQLVQLTATGRVLLRDMATGKLVGDAPGGFRPGNSTTLIGYQGTAYLGNTKEILAADPATGKTRNFFTGTHPGLFPCGAELICVVSGGTMIAKRPDGTEAWRSPRADMHLFGTFRADRIAVRAIVGQALYTSDGEVLYENESQTDIGWIDDDNLLALVGVGGQGRVDIVAVAAEDGRATTIGTLPPVEPDCSWSDQVLACRDGTELKIWKFTR